MISRDEAIMFTQAFDSELIIFTDRFMARLCLIKHFYLYFTNG